MRPDAHRYVRPDWRRFVRPGFERDHPFALYERKYDPNQPRVPAGDPAGGRWTSDRRSNDVPPPQISAVAASTGDGHHHFPGGVAKKIPSLSAEARAVFKQAKTGPLLDPTSNYYDEAHRAYNAAVRTLFDRYLKTNGIDSAKMTADQAREFLGEIFISEDPRIRNFRTRMTYREIRRYITRRMRGAE